jgi:hypothetical protein
MTLFRGFHSIAAQRGDGLRPELLKLFTSEPPSSIKGSAAPNAPDAECKGQANVEGPSVEIVNFPASRR